MILLHSPSKLTKTRVHSISIIKRASSFLLSNLTATTELLATRTRGIIDNKELRSTLQQLINNKKWTMTSTSLLTSIRKRTMTLEATNRIIDMQDSRMQLLRMTGEEGFRRCSNNRKDQS